MQGKTVLMFLTNYAPDDPTIQSIVREVLAQGADGKSSADWATCYKNERFRELLQGPQDSTSQGQ
jgi:hypothetical protein